jgi:maleate cis-trans isomerase
MLALGAALTCWLCFRVIAINTATVWHTYRTHGIADQVAGFGCLLEKY